MAAGYIALQDEHRNRARSLSADSTRPEHDRGSCYFGESQHDFRRKASRQNSYLEAIKQVGGGKLKFSPNQIAAIFFSIHRNCRLLELLFFFVTPAFVYLLTTILFLLYFRFFFCYINFLRARTHPPLRSVALLIYMRNDLFTIFAKHKQMMICS